MKYYSGIGSRETPWEVLTMMENCAEKLGEMGWVLRSGGADGADSAFERGAKKLAKPKMEIYIAWEGFNGHKISKTHLNIKDEVVLDKAFDIASEIHPAWDKCSAGAQALHTRNVFQILGSDLATPSKFVLYWANESDKGVVSGGTATAVKLARQHSIPCFNLKFEDHRNRVFKLLEK